MNMSRADKPEETLAPTKNPIKRLYNWTLSLASKPHALTALIVISFLESSFFPIPPDILLIPLVLGALTKWWRFALWCTVASVLGGIFGYGIGLFAWKTVGIPIIENVMHIPLVEVNGQLDIALPNYITQAFSRFVESSYLFQAYDEWNAWIVILFGLTPLPYKLVTITAGVAQVNFAVFILASIFARGLRFFVIAYILRRWGGKALEYIDKYFNIAVTLFFILLVGGFVLVKMVFTK